MELKRVTIGVLVVNYLTTLDGGFALPYMGYGVCQLRWDRLTVRGSRGRARPLGGWVGRSVGSAGEEAEDINKPTGRHPTGWMYGLASCSGAASSSTLLFLPLLVLARWIRPAPLGKYNYTAKKKDD